MKKGGKKKKRLKGFVSIRQHNHLLKGSLQQYDFRSLPSPHRSLPRPGVRLQWKEVAVRTESKVDSCFNLRTTEILWTILSPVIALSYLFHYEHSDSVMCIFWTLQVILCLRLLGPLVLSIMIVFWHQSGWWLCFGTKKYDILSTLTISKFYQCPSWACLLGSFSDL